MLNLTTYYNPSDPIYDAYDAINANFERVDAGISGAIYIRQQPYQVCGLLGEVDNIYAGQTADGFYTLEAFFDKPFEPPVGWGFEISLAGQEIPAFVTQIPAGGRIGVRVWSATRFPSTVRFAWRLAPVSAYAFEQINSDDERNN